MYVNKCYRCGAPNLSTKSTICNACQQIEAINRQTQELTRKPGQVSRPEPFISPSPISENVGSLTGLLLSPLALLAPVAWGYLLLCWAWWTFKLFFVIFYSVFFGWQGWPSWIWVGVDLVKYLIERYM